MAPLTAVQLKTIMPRADAATWIDALNAAMEERQINTPQRMAAFLAQIAHESGELTHLEEKLSYSAMRMCQVWPKRFPTLESAQPYARNPERLANRVYAGRLGNGDEASGDGWRYRGRGLIQLTGKSNYERCRQALVDDVAANPDLLLQPRGAARSAAWFWESRGLNELADHEPGDDDVEDFETITVKINGGTVGLPDRMDYWEHALQVLSA